MTGYGHIYGCLKNKSSCVFHLKDTNCHFILLNLISSRQGSVPYPLKVQYLQRRVSIIMEFLGVAEQYCDRNGEESVAFCFFCGGYSSWL